MKPLKSIILVASSARRWLCHRESLLFMGTQDGYYRDIAFLLILENRQPRVAAPRTKTLAVS
jgi:hypothetical protein